MNTLKFVCAAALISFISQATASDQNPLNTSRIESPKNESEHSFQFQNTEKKEENHSLVLFNQQTPPRNQIQQQRKSVGLFQCLAQARQRFDETRLISRLEADNSVAILEMTNSMKEQFVDFGTQLVSYQGDLKKEHYFKVDKLKNVLNLYSDLFDFFLVFCESVGELNSKILKSDPASSVTLNEIDESLAKYKMELEIKKDKRQKLFNGLFDNQHENINHYWLKIKKNVSSDSIDLYQDIQELKNALSDIKFRYENYIVGFSDQYNALSEEIDTLFNNHNKKFADCFGEIQALAQL
jgi:hypothetical protein